jgi:hypothetical protein
MSVNGVAQTVGFDALGRTTSIGNALDTFNYGYADGTARTTSIMSTSGPDESLTYFGPSGDELLQQWNYQVHGGWEHDRPIRLRL